MSGRWSMAAVAAVLGMLASTSAVALAAPGDIARELEESRHELEAAERGLEVVSTSVDQAQEELGRVDGQLRAATVELTALEQELAVRGAALDVAEADLRRAEADLTLAEMATRRATKELEAATWRLQDAEDQLDQEQHTLEAQAADAYKHGRAAQLGGVMTTVMGASSTDALRAMRLARSVLEHQRGAVDRMVGLRRVAAAERVHVDEAREERLVQQAAAEEARTVVAALTEHHRRLVAEQRELVGRQRTLVGEIGADQARQHDLLARLHADQQAYASLVDHLENESARLAAELEAELARQRAAASSRQGQWSAGAPGAGQLVWPTAGRPGSRFGWRTHPVYGTRRLHAGVDIGAPTGQAIVAAADGQVLSAGWRGGYGNCVVIVHGGGVATLYAHQSRIVVSPGQRVAAGEKIGEIGSTGLSTGPHLHFEVRVDGQPRDPMLWY